MKLKEIIANSKETLNMLGFSGTKHTKLIENAQSIDCRWVHTILYTSPIKSCYETKNEQVVMSCEFFACRQQKVNYAKAKIVHAMNVNCNWFSR